MATSLDIRTLFLLGLLVNLVLGLVMLRNLVAREAYPGFMRWVLAAFLFGAGYGLLALRDLIPLFVSVILANGVFGVGLLLLKVGLSEFLSAGKRRALELGLFLLFVGFLSHFTMIQPDILFRYIVHSAYFGYLAVSSAFIAFRGTKRLFGSPYYMVSGSLMGLGGSLLLLLGVGSVDSIRPLGLLEAGSLFIVSQGITLGFGFSVMISLLALNGYRLSFDLRVEREKIAAQRDDLEKANESLSTALAEIKTLKGILPICSFCKKIRNDEGYWDRLEKYLSENTEAQLSHGFCPECLQREYPEESEAMKSEGEFMEGRQKTS